MNQRELRAILYSAGLTEADVSCVRNMPPRRTIEVDPPPADADLQKSLFQEPVTRNLQ